MSVFRLSFRYHWSRMPKVFDSLQGFEREGKFAKPRTRVNSLAKRRLATLMLAVSMGYTPEEITEFLADGFPDEVTEVLMHPLEEQEMADHVDVFVATLEKCEQVAA